MRNPWLGITSIFARGFLGCWGFENAFWTSLAGLFARKNYKKCDADPSRLMFCSCCFGCAKFTMSSFQATSSAWILYQGVYKISYGQNHATLINVWNGLQHQSVQDDKTACMTSNFEVQQCNWKWECNLKMHPNSCSIERLHTQHNGVCTRCPVRPWAQHNCCADWKLWALHYFLDLGGSCTAWVGNLRFRNSCFDYKGNLFTIETDKAREMNHLVFIFARHMKMKFQIKRAVHGGILKANSCLVITLASKQNPEASFAGNYMPTQNMTHSDFIVNVALLLVKSTRVADRICVVLVLNNDAESEINT